LSAQKKSFLKLSWCRLCEILFRLISTLSSLINRCRSFSRSFSRRIRDRSAVKNVSNFDREFFFQMRFWRESCRLQSLRTS
jgi:hypothetical protein